jgi:hypothetical protein
MYPVVDSHAFRLMTSNRGNYQTDKLLHVLDLSHLEPWTVGLASSVSNSLSQYYVGGEITNDGTSTSSTTSATITDRVGFSSNSNGTNLTNSAIPRYKYSLTFTAQDYINAAATFSDPNALDI